MDLPPDTPEQAAITRFKGRKLVVKAFAGTGKTTTLVKYSLANPEDRMLYLAYNRAIADEARAKFPPNVECKTSHQLAYAAIGYRYRHKLTGNIRGREILETIGTTKWVVAKDILETLNAFLCSEDEKFEKYHFSRSKDGIQFNEKQVAYRGKILRAAQLIWAKMLDPQDPFPMSHDGYLKAYQLSNPSLSGRYQTILFDEAQDASPVVRSIVLNQSCKAILVGDDAQQIYAWRGAVNALDDPALKDAQRLYLTNSFRFGPAVAAVANVLLSLKGERIPVHGRGNKDSVARTLPKSTRHAAYLYRTVAGVIQCALDQGARGMKIFWIGGIEAYQLDSIEDLYHFSKENADAVQNKKLLKDFYDYQNYLDAAEETQDPEMKRYINILTQHKDLPSKLGMLRRNTVKDESEADITVSTTHRCKGLEWENVHIGDDYPDIFEPEVDPEYRDGEINLLYVAATRAKQHLAVNDQILTAIELVNRQRSKANKAPSLQPS